MNSQTFTQRIAYSFALLCALTLVTAILGAYALVHVTESKDRIQNVNNYAANSAQQLQTEVYKQSAAIRGSILTQLPVFSTALMDSKDTVKVLEARLSRLVGDDEGRRLLNGVETATTNFDARLTEIQAMQYPPASASAVVLVLFVAILVAGMMRIVDVRKELVS